MCLACWELTDHAQVKIMNQLYSLEVHHQENMDGWKGTMIILTFQTTRIYICSEEDVGRESVVMLAICVDLLHSDKAMGSGQNQDS